MSFLMHKSTRSTLVAIGVTLIDTNAIADLYDPKSAQDSIARIEASALGTSCAEHGISIDHTIGRWWRMARHAGWSADSYQEIVTDAYHDACAERGLCAWTVGTVASVREIGARS